MTVVAGTIYLVGAGPGNPDLLTIKAKEVIENADYILHDAVVSREILALAGKAQLIDAGLAGFANIEHQQHLAMTLVKLANNANVVVRLKSGDPFIFGNGGETVQFILSEIRKLGNNTRLEIIPGISSRMVRN